MESSLIMDKQAVFLNQCKKVYLYFFVFMLIYLEFGYKMVVAGALSGVMRICLLLAISFPLLFFVKQICVQSVGLLLYLTLIIVLSAVRDATLDNTIIFLIPIYIGFIVTNTIRLKTLIRIFSNIMVFLAGYSLVIYLLTVIFPGLMAMLPFIGYVYESSASIHDAFFSVCIINAQFVRNYGIAWEPGAFALLLSVAVYYMILFERKNKVVKTLILCCAVLTTFSTLGYIVLVGILFIAFLQKQKSVKIRRLALTIIICLIVLFLLLPKSVKDIVFSKLSGIFADEDVAYTTQARLNAIKYPLIEFLKSPLWGIGYDNFYEVNVTLCDGVATNTIMNWFAVLGVLLGGPCTYYYLKFIYKNAQFLKLPWYGCILLMLIAVFLVSTESLLRISLIYIIIFYGTQNVSFEDIGSL